MPYTDKTKRENSILISNRIYLFIYLFIKASYSFVYFPFLLSLRI